MTTTLENDGEDAAKHFYARARGASLIALTIVTVLGMIFARPLTDLFADGYKSRPEEFERTVTMTRVVFPYIFFMGTAALGAAALNAKRAFGVAAFAPGLLNVAFLVAAFVLPPILIASGIDRAQALTIGALIGGVLQVVAQWPALRRIGYLTRPIVDLSDPKVRDMARRIAPMAFGIGVYYIDLTLSRRFLSELGPGAQSNFTWAMRLCDFPQGIFVMALSTAALPSLSALAARGERSELAETFVHGLKLALFVALPASALLAFLAHPIVVTLFQRGQFTALASSETARALLWQGGAIWTVTVVRQTVPVFYALGDPKAPVWISALDLIAFIALALLLRGPMGAVGISVAVAGSSAVQMILLLLVLRRRLPELGKVKVIGSITRSTLASLVAAGLGYLAAQLTAQVASAGPIGRMLPGVAAIAAFAIAFVLAAHAFGSDELAELLRAVKARLGRKRGTASAA